MPSHFLLKLVLRDVTTWSLAQERGFVLPIFISFTLLFFFIFYMLVSKLSGLRHMMIKILRSLNYQYFCSGHRHKYYIYLLVCPVHPVKQLFYVQFRQFSTSFLKGSLHSSRVSKMSFIVHLPSGYSTIPFDNLWSYLRKLNSNTLFLLSWTICSSWIQQIFLLFLYVFVLT